MRSICFYFQVHQPFRLKKYRFFDIGKDHHYYDDYQNSYIIRRVSDKCYLPMNQVLLDLINEYGSNFKIAFSISGTAIDQFERYAPDVIESFKKLAATGSVEFLSETYTHSLSALKSKTEFTTQVKKHQNKIKELFNIEPQTFRNTELIYSDEIGSMVDDMGFKTMLTEGAKHIMGWKSPNYMYCNAINPRLKLLLKNFQLSDDIAFRFSQNSWPAWPLTTEKFVGWLNEIDQNEEVVNLFMDYETFGEHQWESTGIFEFMKALPGKVLGMSNFTFNTPSELSDKLQVIAPIHVQHPISWADEERDLTAWLGNELQDEAYNKLYQMEEKVKAVNDYNLTIDWEYLQTSDHFYYMCTKWFSDGDVHKYFNPYGTPYEAFINYMNVFSDFEIRVNEAFQNINKSEINNLDSDIYIADIPKDNTISDILNISDTKIKSALKKIDSKTISQAVAKANDDLRNKFFINISKKSIKEVESILAKNKFTTKQITEAQRKILKNI
ncbi:MAG: alpha-amylase [Bacteroidetes bacterium CG2_30_33_31]|nr:MAG: alpha-amylase [Bacteroidetes bacterium CG2_30_33_31]